MSREEAAARNRALIATDPALSAFLDAVKEVVPKARVAYLKVGEVELGSREAYEEKTENPFERRRVAITDLKAEEQRHIAEALEAGAGAGGRAYRGKGARVGRRA